MSLLEFDFENSRQLFCVRVVCCRLTDHLASSDLLNPHQSAIPLKRPTVHAIRSRYLPYQITYQMRPPQGDSQLLRPNVISPDQLAPGGASPH